MGMFDIIRCEHPLPGLLDPLSIEFQAKDIDEPSLNEYKITADGRLLLHKVLYEDSGKEEEADVASQRWLTAWSHRLVDCGWIDTEYHGVFNFYGDKYMGKPKLSEASGFDALLPREWFEYRAKFTDGKLVDVLRVS